MKFMNISISIPSTYRHYDSDNECEVRFRLQQVSWWRGAGWLHNLHTLTVSDFLQEIMELPASR